MKRLSENLSKLMKNRTFLCALIFIIFTLGIWCFYSVETFIVSFIVTLLTVVLLFIASISSKFQKVIGAHFIFIFYLIFLLGFLIAKVNYVTGDDFSNIYYIKDAGITGIVQSIPKHASASNTLKFSLKVSTLETGGEVYKVDKGKILVSLKDFNRGNKIKFGDKILIRGTLTSPKRADNPSQFDYKKFLANKGIFRILYGKDGVEFISSPEISQIKDIKGIGARLDFLNLCFTRKMHDIRDDVILEHSKYIKSPALEILGGVVFGDDAVNPTDEVKGSFINSGLLHLLAASGLNVAFILSMWLCIVYFININYRLKILSGIFIVFLYTVMTGFPPSIVRASVMFTLMLFGKFIYREASGVSLVFTAGFLILLFKPEFLTDVGFQLSFLVTLGLTICIPCVSKIFAKQDKKFMKKIKKYPKFIKSFLLIFLPTSLLCCVMVPFVAQLWAGPLQAYYFNTFSSYSVFANLAVVPFIGLVSCLGFISTAICFVPFLADLILPPLDFVLNIIIHIVLNISNFFSSLNYSIIKVPSPDFLKISCFYLFVIFVFLSIKHLFKNKTLNTCLLISFILLSLQFIKIPDNSSEVIFFSVGNADNCLIKTKNNKYILIDTGKYIYNGLSSAKLITLEYFYDNNIRELDTVVVTHFDSDHSGGLIDILENVRVKNLVIPELECTSKNSCAIKKYIEENKIPYIKPYSGQKFEFGDGSELLNFVPQMPVKKSRNDTSTVSLFKDGDFNFLFMADAGLLSYNSIDKYIPSNIDVLKSAHHGANRTVDDVMLNKLNPDYSILSTGRNFYGHPTRATLYLLNKYSKPLQTSELGAIKFKLKDKIKLFHFNSNKRRFVELKFNPRD